jgi:hypothetical protein
MIIRVSLSLAASLSLISAIVPAHATVVITGITSSVPTAYNFAPSTVITFDDLEVTDPPGGYIVSSSPFISDGYLFTGKGGVVNGSTPVTFMAPAGDTTNYLATTDNKGSGSESVSFGSTQSKFGLYWGSVDSYNTLTFLLGGKVVGKFTGSDVASSFDKYGNSGVSDYVNFAGKFDEVTFSATEAAFEVDNLAIAGAVPEPATWALMLAGFAGLGFAGYRQTKRSGNLAVA